MLGIGTNRETAGEFTTRSQTGEFLGRRARYAGSSEFLLSTRLASCSRRSGPELPDSPDLQVEPMFEIRKFHAGAIFLRRTLARLRFQVSPYPCHDPVCDCLGGCIRKIEGIALSDNLDSLAGGIVNHLAGLAM